MTIKKHPENPTMSDNYFPVMSNLKWRVIIQKQQWQEEVQNERFMQLYLET